MVLRPWLDGRIPESRGPGVLLAAGRADVEVTFVELVGDSAARVYFPADSDNEVVCTAAEGQYSVGAACPAVLGADGRVAMVYPPLVTEGDPVFVGETTATIIESVEAVSDDVQATNAIIEAHEGKILAVEEGVEETKDLLAATDSVVAGLSVEVASQAVDVQAAVQAATNAQQRVDSAPVGTSQEFSVGSETVAGSTWTLTAPVVGAGEFLWQRTTVTYGDGSTQVLPAFRVTGSPGAKGESGAPGAPGADGLPGKDGVGLTGTAITYAKSSSATTAPTSGWQSQPPSPTKGQYLWTKTVWSYSDGSSETGYSTAYWATDGAKGADGAPGDTGPQGVSVTAVIPYYQTVTAGAVKPAKPTVAAPSGWVTVEPAWTADTDLYRCEKVTYSNSSFQWTNVSLVSAYVAASQAINIANASAAQLRFAFDPEPPASPVEGAVWFPRNEAGDVTGMWQWNGSEWGTHTTLTGLLLVPTADGGQTLIGPDGVEATSIVADILRADVLYADVAGVQTLVITDIPRSHLAEDVGEALATAEDLGSRIVLSGGQLTIARNRVSDNEPLTAVTLGATSLDFVVDDKAVAYIDSELEQMSIANGLFRDSMTVGSHQVRTLPGSQVTIWQAVN